MARKNPNDYWDKWRSDRWKTDREPGTEYTIEELIAVLDLFLIQGKYPWEIITTTGPNDRHLASGVKGFMEVMNRIFSGYYGILRPSKNRSKKPFVKEELKRMKQARNAGIDDQQIAKLFGRTPFEIEQSLNVTPPKGLLDDCDRLSIHAGWISEARRHVRKAAKHLKKCKKLIDAIDKKNDI